MSARLPRLRRLSPLALAVIAIAAGALVLRLVDLGARAMHHDESLHATYAWYFAEGRGYEHNPLMHGPLLFHTVAALFKLAGDSEVTARLPMALAGTALVLTPLLFRRWLGTAGTVAAALLLALSPVLLYYSRFARNDVIAVLWTVLLVAAVWRYRDDGRARWLVLAAGALALAFATKETSYLAVAMLLLYLEATLTAALLDQQMAQQGARGWRRVAAGLALFPVAWLVAALWRPLGPLRARLGWAERPREADLVVVLGTLTLPFLVAGVQAVVGEVEPGGLVTEHGETAAIVLLVAASAAVGLAWDWRRWPLLALIVAAVTLPLFTTWFTNADGVRSAFWGQLDYWLDQQDVRRGNQPGFYYLMMLPLYEFLALIPALVGAAWLLSRGDRLTRLLLWWLLSTFVALSFAGEKMPWLAVHLAVPLALLAGRALGAALPAARRRLGRPGRSGDARAGALGWAGWAGTGAAAVAGVLVLALSVRAASGVTFGHPDTPVEPLIYTQTAPDIPRLAREIEDYVAARAESTPVVVDTTASLTWPWAWYLRDLPDVRYLPPQTIQRGELPEGAFLISARSTLPPNSPLRERFGVARPYVHRWWFPEGGYRATSFGSLAGELRSGELLGDWASFVSERGDEAGLGALRGEVLFPLPGP